MKGAPTTLWGKLEREGDEPVHAWHPLFGHCADVAACAEALLRDTSLGRKLAKLSGREGLDELSVARLGALAALHDIGKLNLGFQRKGDAEPRDVAGHVREVLAVMGSTYAVGERLLTVLPARELSAWAPDDAGMELLIASIGHHGRPVSLREMAPRDAARLWERDSTRDPFVGLAELVRLVRSWFPAAFAGPPETLPGAPAFQHAFSGLVMLADWLGSDRDFFPFAEDLGDRMPFARERAREIVRALHLDPTVARASLGPRVPGFDRVSSHPEPNEAQRKTLEAPRPVRGGLLILESETGSGKTEAALARFAQLFHDGLVDGMVFALPTRSAATQIHTRITDAMRLAFPEEEARPPVVLAVPGYLQVDDARGKRLPRFEVLWNDEPRERYRYRGWAAEQPKRFLAGAIVVGTVDQVLLSSLRVGHAHLRATSLLRQLLVVDEVHASDAYMTRILEEVLRFHLAAGGHALLMSATLGTSVRDRFAWILRGGEPSTRSLEEALSAPYPAVHDGAVSCTLATSPVRTAGLPKEILVHLAPIADEPETIAANALEAARQGARVLVLRNTVADALATQDALETLASEADAPLLLRVRGVPVLHHSRFARPDRTLLDEAIEARFGKGAPARGGVIAVATQTVQQSLDLDADAMFTDLAPMDVLLQRFGRVHRHPARNPDRPAGYEAPQVWVLCAEAPLSESLRENGDARGRHGVGTVYEDVLILEATRQRLERSGVLRIPADNRELVEVTTHPEAIAALAGQLGEKWTKHAQRRAGVVSAHKGLAGLNLVDRQARFGDYTFKTSDATERITTRLGEGDRRALFIEPFVGPFGERVRELHIPAWLARELPPDPELAPTDVSSVETAHGPSIRFRLGPTPFAYDRLGLRKDESADDSTQDDPAGC